MARQPSQQQLTFYLIKEQVESSAILRQIDGVREYDVPALPGLRPALFIRSVAPHPPKWVTYLSRQIAADLGPLFAASASAVLLFEAAGRILALTFGQGRHLLDPGIYEQDFGLRVVLNTVAPDQLRSIDAKTTEELTLHTRRDVSRASSLPAFGLDISRDLMRAVTGVPEDESLGRRVSGADALAVASRAQLPDLPGLGERLVAAYGANRYKEHFDFIDHLRPVRDRTVVDRLNAKLVDTLRTREIDDLHLAAPEPLDWRNLEGFRFSSQRDDAELDTDPRISTYLTTRDAETLTLEQLKHDRVLALSAEDGDILKQWTLYRCIVFETSDEQFLYVLSAGDWYRVSRSFKDAVWEFVQGLPVPTFSLPPAELGIDEGAYNEIAAAATGSLNLDRQLVRRSFPDPVEVCDFLTPERQLVHVKNRGRSSTLSHLFAQGITSAELLLEDAAFRAEAHEIVQAADPAYADVLPSERPAAEAYEVVYVVITRSTRSSPLTLPFFALVSLRSATRRLRGMGYRVSATTVLEGSPRQ